jgi:Zn-dependent metalloprotease
VPSVIAATGPRKGGVQLRGRNRHSCFIVQPHILEQFVKNGTPEQREWALNTLALDHSIRTGRMANALIESTAPRRPQPLLAPAGGAPRRTIYDAKGAEDPTVQDMVRKEGQAKTADPAVNEAYDGLGATYKFYWEIFHRNSIDDQGMQLDGVVHFGQNYDNAFWNGSRMIFGDGDGQVLTRTTAAVDVIGHELTHGVTEHTAGLAYSGQSGALNEACSDIGGIMVKQYLLGQTVDKSDWLIGEGIVGPALHGKALRSMAAPGTAYEGDVQPATMTGYVRTTRDNGGVHINSGIPNHAFYNIAMAIGGHAWEKAGHIWYETLRDPRMQPTATFDVFAQVMVRQAQHLYGATSSEVKAVKDGWKKVGVAVP